MIMMLLVVHRRMSDHWLLRRLQANEDAPDDGRDAAQYLARALAAAATCHLASTRRLGRWATFGLFGAAVASARLQAFVA